MTDQVIGQHLFELRNQQNLSQSRVAEYLTRVTGNKWNQQLVSRAEKGDRQFRVVDLFAIAGIFEVSVLALMYPNRNSRHDEVKAGNLTIAADAFYPLWVARPREHRGDTIGYADRMPPRDPKFEESIEGFLEAITWESVDPDDPNYYASPSGDT
jgi:transcriptional regulator with XRE-family HTH domain